MNKKINFYRPKQKKKKLNKKQRNSLPHSIPGLKKTESPMSMNKILLLICKEKILGLKVSMHNTIGVTCSFFSFLFLSLSREPNMFVIGTMHGRAREKRGLDLAFSEEG